MSFLAPASPNLRFGPFELDTAAGELRKAGILIKLQPQPFHVLLLLARRAGTVVTREEIQRCLWSDSTFVDFEHGINFSINQIRSALADSADRPRYIETLPRRGYRFIAKVAHEGSAREVPIAHTPGAAPDPGAAGGDVTHSSSASELFIPALPLVTATTGWRKRKLILAAAGAGIVLLGFSALIKYRATFRKPGINFETLQLNKLTDSGGAVNVAISPDGHYVVYERREAKGLGLWVRQVATHSDVEVLPPGDFEFDGITFSPDGNYIYFVRSDEKDYGYKYLYTMPALGGPPRLLIKDIDSPVSFSPDGREFVFTRGIPTRDAVEVRIANANGSGDRLLVSLSDTWVGFQPGATWSPDRRSIAVSRMLHGKRPGFVLDSLSVADGSLRELYSSAYQVGRPLWLPEGDSLLVPLGDRSDRNQLWTISYPGGETRRLTNDLASYDFRIDLTRDARTVAAIERTITSNVWVAPTEDPTRDRQITVGELPMVEVLALPQGKILTRSEDGDLWIMNSDGSQRASFADLHNASTPAACGRFLVFNSSQTGLAELMRVDIDGRNATKLVSVSGRFFPPVCSPDGKFVYYVQLGQPQKIMRIPIEGGSPVEIAKVEGDCVVGGLNISPDGESLAYPFEVYHPEPVTKVAVVPTGRGAPKRAFKVPGGIRGRVPRWSPARKGLQFLLTQNAATNIWEQPLDGRTPKQLTRFSSGLIFDFNWSLDGKQLFLAKGDSSSSVILLSHFR